MMDSISLCRFRKWLVWFTLVFFFAPVITYVLLWVIRSIEWIDRFLIVYNLLFAVLIIVLPVAAAVAFYKTTTHLKLLKGLLAGCVTALLMVTSWGVMNFVFHNNCCLDDSAGQEAFERWKESQVNSLEDSI